MGKQMDNVNNPAHYADNFNFVKCECIDLVRNLDFFLGNTIKYIWRAGDKGDLAKALEDLEKADWYFLKHCGEFPYTVDDDNARASNREFINLLEPKDRIQIIKTKIFEICINTDDYRAFAKELDELRNELIKEEHNA